MVISELIKKENIQYLERLLKQSSNGILIMFFIVSVLIAIVVDTCLSFTFPAYTLITTFVCAFILSVTIYVKNQENKAIKRQVEHTIQQEFEYVRPMLNHLTEQEKDLIKPLAVCNSIEVTDENKAIMQQISMKGFYRYITTINYPGLPCGFDVVKPTPIFQEILKRYFKN